MGRLPNGPVGLVVSLVEKGLRIEQEIVLHLNMEGKIALLILLEHAHVT